MLTLPGFTLVRARALPEALDAMADGRGIPLAGGTDLIPNMKRGLMEPLRLVSLRRVRELSGVHVDAEGALVLGSCATLRAIAEDERVARGWPIVASAARTVASSQIRNVATLGGNLCLDTRCAYYNQSAFWRGALGDCLKTCGDACHVVTHGRRCVAALSADMPPALIASGAEVRLASKHGERTLPLTDFYTADGAHNTVRKPDEVLVDVRVPRAGPGTRGVYAKVRPRAAIDFPALSIAAVVGRRPDGAVESIRLVVGALAPRPRVIDGLDAVAVGRPLDARLIGELAERARAACHPLPNVEVDADWRRAVLPVHVRRALTAIATP